MSAPSADDLAVLQRQQQESLGLPPRARLTSPADAERLLQRVGLALRYQATKGLPLASIRSAVGPLDSNSALVTSIDLTNHLLATSCGIEVNVVAGRLTIVHRSLIPALYVLVRRGRAGDDLAGLSLAARTALALVRERRTASAGDVRTRLGAKATPRHDPAYDALGELQRLLLVDRGPFDMPAGGIPYLSREGYPYRVFQHAHADLVAGAKTLSVTAATDRWLLGYLDAAVFAAPRKLASLFRSFLSAAEIAGALERLAATGKLRIQRVGRDTLAIIRQD